MSSVNNNQYDDAGADSPKGGEDPRLVAVLEEYQRELDA